MPGTEDYWIQTYGKVALTGEPIHFKNFAARLDRHYEVFAYSPVPRQFAAMFTDVTDEKRRRSPCNTASSVGPPPLQASATRSSPRIQAGRITFMNPVAEKNYRMDFRMLQRSR